MRSSNSSIIVSLVFVGLLYKLVQAIHGEDSCPDVEHKQLSECGEFVPFNQRRWNFRAGAGEFPFIADIQITAIKGDENSKANCSGVIVSEDDILTSIKCARFDSIESIEEGLEVFVGSLYQSKYGEQAAVRKVFKYELEEHPDECNKSQQVTHGLAVLRLAEPLKFRFEKRTCSKQKPRFINSACMSGPVREFYRFNSSQFVDSELCAKALEFKRKRCRLDQPAKVDCATMISGPANLTHGGYQEGAPLVQLTPDNHWLVIGIISKDVEPWCKCEVKDQKDPKLTKFVPLYDEHVKKWLHQVVFKPETDE